MQRVNNLVNDLIKEAIYKCASKYGFDGKDGVKHAMRHECPRPYSESEVDENKCSGLSINHGLYTQCEGLKLEGEYCANCMKDANSETHEPKNGTIKTRDAANWKSPSGKSPTPYLTVLKKLKIPVAEAREVSNIDEKHFQEVSKKVKTAKERGRPKNPSKVVEVNATENLFQALVQQQKEQKQVEIEVDEEDEQLVKDKETLTQEVNEAKEAKALELKEAKEVKEAKALELKEAKEAKEAKALELKEAKEAKEAKALELKEAKEAKALEEKTAKEAKALELKEAKEAKALEEKTAKEAKALELKEAKEAKALEEKKAKEAKALELKEAKEAKTLEEKKAKELAKKEKPDKKTKKSSDSSSDSGSETSQKSAAKSVTSVVSVAAVAVEAAVKVRKLQHKGTTYLHDAKTGSIYDVNSSDHIGQWNDAKKDIDFLEQDDNDLEEEEEEEDDEEEAEEEEEEKDN